MGLVFAMLLAGGSGTGIPPAEPEKTWNMVYRYIYTWSVPPLGDMMMSITMSVMHCLMYYMSEEDFTRRCIAICDEVVGSTIGEATLTYFD